MTIECVRILIILGKYENQLFFDHPGLRTLTNKTALHLAQSSEEIQQALIHSLEDLHSKDLWGNTPFMYQIKQNRPDCALALLKAGADVDISDSHLRKPLEYAVILGHQTFIKSYIIKSYITSLLDSIDEDNTIDLEDENI